MRLLVTGFEPFAGARVNLSWEAVRALAAPDVRVLRVPVVYRRSWRVIERELTREPADALLICGLERGCEAMNDAGVPAVVSYDAKRRRAMQRARTQAARTSATRRRTRRCSGRSAPAGGWRSRTCMCPPRRTW